jgi:hypothetical protein
MPLERWHQHCGPARDLKSEPSAALFVDLATN